MARAVYLVELKNNGKTIRTLRMEAGCQEVNVGRSSQCALQTPQGDHSVSRVHARLFWKGSALYLEDSKSLSGIYFKGEKITKPQKIASGNLFSIGTSCSIRFERPDPKMELRGGRFHKLEYLNGDHAGKMVDIRPKEGETEFVIGRATSCALYLSDAKEYVSRRHALLWLEKDGSECWIKGLGGEVKVNGEIVPAKGRWLKHNDKIEITYYEFRFLDREFPVKRLFIWLKVFAVAATLGIMAVAYVMFSDRVKASECMVVAEQQAAELDFDAAKKTLGAALLARDADKCRVRIDALAAKIDRWKNTVSEWEEAQRLLRDGAFKSAKKILDSLTGGVTDAWSWNGTTAFEDKRKAEFASRLLRQYYNAEESLSSTSQGQPEQQAESIRRSAASLSSFLEKSTSEIAAQPENLAALTNVIASVRKQMDDVRLGFERVDGSIAKLDLVNPDFDSLAKELETIMGDKTSHEAVRAYAEKYRQPCAELAAAKRFIGSEFDDINAMRFESVRQRAGQLRLPGKELCARHPRLSEHRAKLDGHHGDVQDLAKNLRSIMGGLSEQGVENGRCGISLERILDPESWKKALTFDCLNGKVPIRTRTEPCGWYDGLLGVEFTYYSLAALPKDYNGDCLRLVRFEPDIVKAKRSFEAVETFVGYIKNCVERNKWSWLLRGELGSFYKYCQSLLAKRRELADSLVSYHGSPRARLVAGFYAGYLIPGGWDGQSRAELVAQFRKISRNVGELCEQYKNAEPGEQIELRSKILETGVPGDFQLQPKWAAKYDGGQE
ncbi:MAG: FHA domain-containing protein [Kiritimatiellae bacterium]|nr:FHA domain-containing protein [Kiritimatiellia bacterium]